MTIMTKSMAPLVSSLNQAFRTCSRSREPDGEAPRSKRICARVGGSVETVGELEVAKRGLSMEGVAELDAFRPGTPTKDDEPIEKVGKLAGGWEILELCLLERVTRSLSTSDLCQLAQVLNRALEESSKILHFNFPMLVNKHYNELCSRDVLWNWRATEKFIVKAVEQENWRSNFKAALTGSLHAAPLDSFTNLHFSGDVTIVDPFCLFFQGRSNYSKQMELRKIVKQFGHNDLVLTYRGIQCAVLRTSCVIHDDDTAFEVFRNSREVGANVTTCGVIAVVPNRLVLKLIEENGGVPEEVRGVIVPGVDGILRCSSDGDFIIRHSRVSGGSVADSLCSGEAQSADIVCSTGGSWTEDSDSDDEEEELTDEEMAEAVAEVANLTNSFTGVQHFHCNGEGLIHKFTNFEVSMLS